MAAPLANPATPVPAKVVTSPVAVILRIQLFWLSATYIFPEAAMATPVGL